MAHCAPGVLSCLQVQLDVVKAIDAMEALAIDRTALAAVTAQFGTHDVVPLAGLTVCGVKGRDVARLREYIDKVCDRDHTVGDSTVAHLNSVVSASTGIDSASTGIDGASAGVGSFAGVDTSAVGCRPTAAAACVSNPFESDEPFVGQAAEFLLASVKVFFRDSRGFPHCKFFFCFLQPCFKCVQRRCVDIPMRVLHVDVNVCMCVCVRSGASVVCSGSCLGKYEGRGSWRRRGRQDVHGYKICVRQVLRG